MVCCGIKQEIQEFKAEFNSLLIHLKNEIQMKLKTTSKVVLLSKLMKA